MLGLRHAEMVRFLHHHHHSPENASTETFLTGHPLARGKKVNVTLKAPRTPCPGATRYLDLGRPLAFLLLLLLGRLCPKVLDELPDRQIEHDIFGPARDAGAKDIAIDALDDLALPRPRVPVAAEQQDGGLRALVEDHAGLGFGERGEAAELGVGRGFAERVELVEEAVEPGLQGLELGGAFGQPVADDGLGDQGVVEGGAFEGVGQRGGEGDARLAGHGDGDDEALVVEVGHEVLHPVAFGADEVGGGDEDVVECDEGRAGCCVAGDVHAAH